MRHAHAGKRGTWSGPDTARPLDADRAGPGAALAPLVRRCPAGPPGVASPRRCVQTLDPLAELLDLPIEVDAGVRRAEPGQQPERLAAAARLAGAGRHREQPTVVCSQGKVIPPRALDRLDRRAPTIRHRQGRGLAARLRWPTVWLAADRL